MAPVITFFLFVIVVGRSLLFLLEISVEADMRRYERRRKERAQGTPPGGGMVRAASDAGTVARSDRAHAMVCGDT